MKEFIIKHKQLLIFMALVFIFFSTSLVITFDSTHYLTYLDIFEGISPWSSWDIVRGPFYPLVIFISNLIFGKSSKGLLLGMFIVYIVYCFAIYKLASYAFKDTKRKNLYTFLLCVFAYFNPVVLGYFHVMLSEYIAITLSICSVLIGWIWSKEKKKKIRILCSIYFILGVTFSYLVKQPYICATFTPMFVAMIYAFINNHSIKKCTSYIVTTVLSIVVLVCSLQAWNGFLKSVGADYSTGRDGGSILNNQVLGAVGGFKMSIVKDKYSIDIDDDLTNEEKTIAYNELDEGRNVLVVSIYDNKKLLENDIVKVNDINAPSLFASLEEVFSVLFRYPKVVLGSYFANYCALTSVCKIKTDDYVTYYVSSDLDFLRLQENKEISYRPFYDLPKQFPYPEDRENQVAFYKDPQNASLVDYSEKLAFFPTAIIYKIVTMFFPLFLLGNIVFRVRNRKHVKDYDMYLFSSLFLYTALITMLFNACLGAFIDRYGVTCLMLATFGIITSVLFISKNIKKVEKKKRK